jgi:hypothetical protein
MEIVGACLLDFEETKGLLTGMSRQPRAAARTAQLKPQE